MGLLDKLWDDVVAGPQPDRGLGRLRRNPKNPEEGMDHEARRYADQRRRSADFALQQDEARRVTQSISIVKRPPLLRTESLDLDNEPGSTPSTPGAAGTPTSGFVGSPSIFSERDRERLYGKSVSVPTSPAFGRERDNGLPNVFQNGNNKIPRKTASEKFEKQPPNSPTVYDWVVLSALDR